LRIRKSSPRWPRKGRPYEYKVAQIEAQLAEAKQNVDVLRADVEVATQKALRVRFKTSSRITELSQHEADGRKFQERERVTVEIFPVLGEAAATIEPGDRAFDDPTLG
jgi:multidrug resistance efflux pump